MYDSRCATTTYMSGIYNEWKQCSAAEAGIDVGGEGTGTTVTGEECVPMVYSGVSYEGCTSDTYRLTTNYRFNIHSILNFFLAGALCPQTATVIT